MSHDTLVHRLVRPAARRLAAATAVTPNQLTTLRLVTGIAAALALAQGGTLWPDIGAAAMLASLLLDRADGELARATGKTSAGGYRYDLVADGLATIAVFVGMGFGARASWGAASILLGVVAAAGALALFLIMPRVDGKRDGSVARPIDPDDALLLTPLLIWAGLMPWTLLVAAVLSPAVAILLGGVALAKRQRARRGSPTGDRAG